MFLSKSSLDVVHSSLGDGVVLMKVDDLLFQRGHTLIQAGDPQFHVANIVFDLADIATDSPEVFQDQVFDNCA